MNRGLGLLMESIVYGIVYHIEEIRLEKPWKMTRCVSYFTEKERDFRLRWVTKKQINYNRSQRQKRMEQERWKAQFPVLFFLSDEMRTSNEVFLVKKVLRSNDGVFGSLIKHHWSERDYLESYQASFLWEGLLWGYQASFSWTRLLWGYQVSFVWTKEKR